MLSNPSKAFILSALVHGTLLFSFYKTPSSTAPNLTSDFEILLNKGLEKTAQKNKKEKLVKSVAKKVSLNDLKPQMYNSSPFSRKQSHSTKLANDYGSQEGDVNATMNELSLTEYSGNRLFFEIIKSQLDQAIQYPQELVEHNIQGKNWITLLVNHKGQLIRIIDASVSQPTLKTFTIIGAYQALKTPLPKKYWYQPKRNLTLQLHFDFRIYTFGNQQSRTESRYYKNRFEFLRVQNGMNIVEEFVVDNARYIPPIIPLPGGFFFSFTQAYNLIQAWSEMDPKMRKLQRLEMTKEKLDVLLQQEESKHSNSH